jgi:fatty acid desaturase|uniref:fatty acid desaturase n=1 Tax=Cephaloticoccus sp. TaxID=1985742 RepID=UPI00404A8D4C
MAEKIKISWYRCKVDREVMREFIRKSDAKGLAHVIPSILLYATTATLAYFAFVNLNATNWPTALPLVLLALFVHGTFGKFIGGIACHELCHKTPFASQWLNTLFLRTYAFIGLFDHIGYRASHILHHQATVHTEHDGEVVLPQGLDWHGIKFIIGQLTIQPVRVFNLVLFWFAAAAGRTNRDGFLPADWLTKVVPESNLNLRREHRNWARIVLFGHLALAAVSVATGNWFLILIITFGSQYAGWFEALCGAAQHIVLSPNVNDYRLNTRTFTAGWLVGFCYWNMQYHIEHHMFPAVPFYNLPKLREAIKADLPPATHGLWATWKMILPLMRRQRDDPTYFYVPPLPQSEGEHVGDDVVLAEASQ